MWTRRRTGGCLERRMQSCGVGAGRTEKRRGVAGLPVTDDRGGREERERGAVNKGYGLEAKGSAPFSPQPFNEVLQGLERSQVPWKICAIPPNAAAEDIQPVALGCKQM